MSIKSVSIIGLGALGILYADHFTKRLPKEDVQIIADQQRIHRYEKEGIYCNGELCHFNYVTPEAITKTSDLIIIATKFDGLEDAIRTIRPLVGEQTVILSVINGIISEELIGEAYGFEHVLYCVAQQMDAYKVGNDMSYVNKGVLCIGDGYPGMSTQAISRVAEFFTLAELPYEIDDNMRHRLWGKFMLNVGLNQTVASIEGTFSDVFDEGEARTTMIGAMKEVIQLANLEGVALNEDDLSYWLDILSKLNPAGKPSMAQDVDARRISELPLFAGTVLQLGQKHQLATPVNSELFRLMTEKERQY